jgi:hypothetical protein
MDREGEAGIPVTESSGNVFADMGLPEAEEELSNAQLAAISARRLSVSV